MKLDEPNTFHQKPMEELNVKPITQRASSVSDSKLYESKTPLESKKKMEKCQPKDAPNAVQSRDKLIENNNSGSKQRFDDPIAMALNRRLLIEQVPENKFSSLRSVLPENILDGEIPLSDVEQPQKNPK